SGKPVPLPPKAFEVLLALVRRNGATVSKDELLRQIWPDAIVEESNLAQYIFLLRKALGEANRESRYILTVPKIGYRFAADLRPVPAKSGDTAGLNRSAAWDVQQCYLKGRYFWNQRTEEGFRKSIRYFEQAIEMDPGYARAYVGLADSYNLLAYYTGAAPGETYPKAITAARRALELDPTLAEAHASLALAEVDFKWQWAAAEARYRDAIALKADYAMAHDWYAEYLTTQGRYSEAMAEIQRALELDPYSLTANRDFGFLLYMARRYDEAAKQLEDTLEMDQSALMARCFLAGAYDQLGMPAKAVSQVTDALSAEPESSLLQAELAYAYVKLGRRQEAMTIAGSLETKARTRYVSPFDLATIYAALDDPDRVFYWLERACQIRPWRLVYLNVEPRLDPVRADVRFTAIAARMGLNR